MHKFFLQQYLLNFPLAFDFYISGTYFDNWSDGDSCRSLCCCWRVTLSFYKSATKPHFTVASDLLRGVFYALSHTIHLQQTPISDTANLSSFPWIIAEHCRRLHQNYFTWISTVPILIFLWIIIKKKPRLRYWGLVKTQEEDETTDMSVSYLHHSILRRTHWQIVNAAASTLTRVYLNCGYGGNCKNYCPAED